METKPLEKETFDDAFTLVTDRQEIEAVFSAIPQGSDPTDWGCLFVKAADGDYAEVWAMECAVPWLGQTVYRLLPQGAIAPESTPREEPLVLGSEGGEKAFPESVEVEVTPALIAASRPGHLLENSLALALTGRLETRYGVSLHGGGRCLAQPWDDPNAALAAGEEAPWYDFGPRGCAFLRSFDAGDDVRSWNTTWFNALRE